MRGRSGARIGHAVFHLISECVRTRMRRT
jgi:hypothetical protein